MTSLIATALLLLPVLLLHNSSIEAHSNSFSNNLFALEFLESIGKNKATPNVFCSPSSLYRTMATLYLGPKGHKAKKLGKVLGIDEGKKDGAAVSYNDFLKSLVKNTNHASVAGSPVIANCFYLNDKIRKSPKYIQLAQHHINAEEEIFDFTQIYNFVQHVNMWVEEKTNGMIGNLTQPKGVNSDSSIVLVNSIYFKADWLNRKPKSQETKQANNANMVHFARNKFVDLVNLKAVAYEIPFAGSDISALFVFPYGDTLKRLENNLTNMDLNNITSQMQMREDRLLSIPKIRIEYNVDVLSHLGIIGNPLPAGLLNLQHKAYIEFNEDGLVAAASTTPVSSDNSAYPQCYDKSPFIFFIRSEREVYFAGHVACYQ